MARVRQPISANNRRGIVGGVAIPGWLERDPRVVYLRHRDAVSGERASWPAWLPDDVREAVMTAGIEQPWLHQTSVADAAWAGRHVAVSTATASGKSLGYLLPIMSATAVPPSKASLGFMTNDLRSRLGVARHTALYLAPTKALEHDQWAAARELGPKGWQVSCLDGDSSSMERRFAREHASFVLSNPDMLHRSVLPNHAQWSSFLGSLRYVVIDEAHRYRGVFGSQVSVVLRRLRRLCHAYGSTPIFMLASATTSEAGRSGALLIGESDPLFEVREDSAPHAARDIVLWRPESDVPSEAAALLARLVDDGQQVITFIASRNQAELIALRAADRIDSGREVASYRSGYLAGDRRDLEARLRSGELAGVAATNALELGIDISGLDAVVMAGFPGTLGSFWQQSGRAGRGERDALVVLIARDDPLDRHLLDHPELIFDRAVEQVVLHPQNPYVLGPQLSAAAQESPLTAGDEHWFGPTMPSLARELSEQGLLRARPAGWFWTKDYRAVDEIDLRGCHDHAIEIVEAATGRVLGSVDHAAADRTVHEGAVYLHQGEQWLVSQYLPDESVALVRSSDLPYFTQALASSEVQIVRTEDEYPCGSGIVCRGEVELTRQVTGYLRRDSLTGDVWDQTPLELPGHRVMTQAMWWLIPDDVIAQLPFPTARLGAAVHAAEHTAIGLLPAFAPCDRWDIGGLSTVCHPDTQLCTIFVHDGAPGGAGYAERGFEVADQWWRAAAERLTNCGCEAGCPSCCISPKCGNGNRMLDKSAATRLLAALLG